ncbi:MAG: ABC transporter permease [Thermoanaerobaculia bacterium]
MSPYLTAIRVEVLKLKRTLALAMCFLAPAIVVTFQVLLWLRRKDGLGADVEPWLSFLTNVLSMWGLFMLPLTAALVIALVYQAEHAHQGWLRLGALPLPRWSVPAAKASVATALLALATLVLLAGCLGGTLLASALRPGIVVDAAPPIATMLARTARVFAASLLVLAIQNAVSLRWPSMVVPLGTGVAGTFVGLFAAGWRLGPWFPWLMPLHALHGVEDVVARCVTLGSAGGLLVFAATVVLAARRDPGLRA